MYFYTFGTQAFQTLPTNLLMQQIVLFHNENLTL
jgi:hypothetical protein